MNRIDTSAILTSEFVYHALGLQIPDSPPRNLFRSVLTDSRQIEPDSLFVALVGENFDGHQFIQQAFINGASGVICRKGTAIEPSLLQNKTIFYVEDTVQAFRSLAGAWRRRFSIPVIAIAGSAGKTTTKEMLASILSGKFSSVLKTENSQNGFLGIPMTLLKLRPKHQVAVVEIGIDEIGAMKEHIQLVAPTAAVLTAIGHEHLEKLKDIETVAREEGIALNYLEEKGGLAGINWDDPWIRPHWTRAPGKARRIAFSLQAVPADLGSGCEFLLGSVKPSPADPTLVELTFQFHGQFQEKMPGLSIKTFPKELITVPLPGKHNATNLLAAISLAYGLGMNANEIQKGLTRFRGATGRSEIQNLPGPIQVICDYYNAQPTSVEAALELAAELSTGTLWICLGDMLELGPNEEKYHRDLAKKIQELPKVRALLFGPRMEALADELSQSGFRSLSEHFSDSEALLKRLVEGLRPGDTVLIKGSRSMHMEEIWKGLKTCLEARQDPK